MALVSSLPLSKERIDKEREKAEKKARKQREKSEREHEKLGNVRPDDAMIDILYSAVLVSKMPRWGF